MIDFNKDVFKLTTANSCYVFKIDKYGHLVNVHYGRIISSSDYEAVEIKNNAGRGTSVSLDFDDKLYSLDNLALEYSSTGRGDYRHPPMEIKMPNGGFVNEFCYFSHEIFSGNGGTDDDFKGTESSLPLAVFNESEPHDENETLHITLKDKASEVFLHLYYTVFFKTDVIARRVELENQDDNPLVIRKLSSFMLDLKSEDFTLYTLSGNWINEANLCKTELSNGLYVNESITGNSSNKHNPSFVLLKGNGGEGHGDAYGFNLVYSGNHYEAVEKTGRGLLRVMSGVNPHCFEWTLEKEDRFETPQAILTYSSSGLNGITHNMGGFVARHIVRGEHRLSVRPVLVNNWETHFFNFNQRKILSLAKRGKELGAELMVLDDGWFGQRNDDTKGLGDYNVNTKKLKGGLKKLGDKLNKMGLKFGLWFEPEMANIDSELYRNHPEFVIKCPNRTPTFGRNQLVLNLTDKRVQEYIVQNVNKILSLAPISYVKWDMNRHISDMYAANLTEQGRFFHSYILGLYSVLRRIIKANPHVLFEGCASGGNRFDLGMLCFMPQIWCSDNTDPIERLSIQGGLSLMYPQSTFGAHVSAAPHQQTLRLSPLNTRFNVSAFGLLGYEMELKNLTKVQKQIIKNQIAFYKTHREVFQFGKFSRLYTDKDNRVIWQVTSEDGSKIIVGLFQTLARSAPNSDILIVDNIDENAYYTVKTVPQMIEIKRFGGLIKHALPIKINPEGFIMRQINKRRALDDANESYSVSGAALKSGLHLNQSFMGTWYNSTIRLCEGDFASNLYLIEKQQQRLESSL